MWNQFSPIRWAKTEKFEKNQVGEVTPKKGVFKCFTNLHSHPQSLRRVVWLCVFTQAQLDTGVHWFSSGQSWSKCQCCLTHPTLLRTLSHRWTLTSVQWCSQKATEGSAVCTREWREASWTCLSRGPVGEVWFHSVESYAGIKIR